MTMKKFLVMAAVAFMAAMNVNAQSSVEDLKHEIGVTYGLGLSVFGDGIGYGISNGIFDKLLNRKWVNQEDFGTLCLEYFYHLSNPRWAVGGIVGYSQCSEDVENRDDGQIVGSRSRKYYTAMPSAKYYWVNKQYFGLYSKAALGVSVMTDKEEMNNRSDSSSRLYMAWQVSALCLEGGLPNARLFVEFGAGEQGILWLGGIRAKF
jgi:hypothetical protein